MITYKSIEANSLRVYLDNRNVGTIRRVDGGFAYYPNGRHLPGETFKTVAEVKQSIEAE